MNTCPRGRTHTRTTQNRPTGVLTSTFDLPVHPSPNRSNQPTHLNHGMLITLEQRQQQHRHLVQLPCLRSDQHSFQFLFYLAVPRRSDQEGWHSSTLRAAGNGGLQIIKLTQKQDSQFFPNQSPSPAYLNLPQDADSYDDFGDLFAGLEKRNSALYDGGILSKPPAPVVLRSVCSLSLSRTSL